jgi:hypothetical protein
LQAVALVVARPDAIDDEELVERLYQVALERART